MAFPEVFSFVYVVATGKKAKKDLTFLSQTKQNPNSCRLEIGNEEAGFTGFQERRRPITRRCNCSWVCLSW